jgi:hypothetical protein
MESPLNMKKGPLENGARMIIGQIWSKAEKLYGKKKNYSHIFQIQQELQFIKQQPNQSISDIFSLLQEKNDELKLYIPPTAILEEL